MIYVVAHKPVQALRLPGYQPIQVGGSDDDFPGYIRDNSGENISEKNPSFCELTALYWIWKNAKDEYKGLVHYRRFFGRRPFSSSAADILSHDELAAMLRECDIIAARPVRYHVNAREQLLMECCSPENFDKLEAIVSRTQPTYADAFRRFFAGNRAAQYNMMFCREELFDEYCTWLFPMLFELEKHVDLSGANDYQRRLFGFLSERLLNVWIDGRGLKVKYVPVVSTAYTFKDHLTYFRRDITNDLRFRLRHVTSGRRARNDA